jgi:hypothetical protein
MRSSGNGHRTETPDVSHIRNVEVGYEASDINVRGVLAFILALTLALAGASTGVWFLFGYLNKEKAKERPPGPLAIREESQRLPPEPRLQGSKGFEVTLENGQKVPLELSHPQAEYETLLQQWQSALQTGVKDSNGNVVGMPINDAMKKVVSGEGLPARTKQGKVDDYGIGYATDSSSGRETVKFK